VRLNKAKMIDYDLRIGIAEDQLEPLVEPPGNVQVDRERQTSSLHQHSIEVRIGGGLGVAPKDEQHATAYRTGSALPVRDDLRDGRVGRIDRLDEGKPGGMALVHLERIAGVVAVDRERRNQDCAVDADGVHRDDHLVTRDLARSRQYGVPRPARVIALVGMHLRVDDQHILALPLMPTSGAAQARLHSRYLFAVYPTELIVEPISIRLDQSGSRMRKVDGHHECAGSRDLA